ncbi:MAG: hypothetical protein JWR19_405 [Pedosphaera sp.]|nr:hypothetical protein [Pedosphaera sp.]
MGSEGYAQTKDLLVKIPNVPYLYRHSVNGIYNGSRPITLLLLIGGPPLKISRLLARPSFGRKTHQNVHRNNTRVSITRSAKVLRDNP